MGIPPPFDGYDPGVSCPACESSLFNGVTPLYVEVHVSGITLCPGAPPLPAPNGVFLLTQIAACSWLVFSGPIFFQWTISATNSNFIVAASPVIYFSETVAIGCHTQFVNQMICGVGPAAGTGGTAEIFWGPTIGPGP